MWGMHWRKAEALRGLSFLTIIILFYLWRRRAPQLLLPESSSSLLFQSLSLSLSVSARRSWNRPARPEREQGGRGGGGSDDQRARDHARAVTAAASHRAPSSRSTSNNPGLSGPERSCAGARPGPETARTRDVLPLGAKSLGPH